MRWNLTADERLHSKLRQNGECLEFTGYRDRKGYGQMGRGTRVFYAHRVAWELTHGPVPKGLHVCHACDNPPCCNVAHLFLGTNAENTADRDAKGRTFNGQATKTRCKRGHAFTPENTYPQLGGAGRGCRTCRNMRQRERRAISRTAPESSAPIPESSPDAIQ